MPKRGIVIANTGSPDAPTPEAVKTYLSEFLTDEHIMPMNPAVWKFILHSFILPRRSQKSAAKYALIWTEAGSPLTVTMGSLALKLEAALRSQGVDALVLSAGSYGSPSLAEALRTCIEAGCDEVIVVPLYPQSAYSTTSVVEDRAQAAWRELVARREREQATAPSATPAAIPALSFIPPYYQNPLYTEALAKTIRAAGFGDEPDDRLLFAFHSIPLCDIKEGDTYHDQVVVTTHAVADLLGLNDDDWALGFQCRFDRSRSWLRQFVPEAIEELETARPIGRLFVVAPNFSIDCLETLYDIEIELRERYCGDTANNADNANNADKANHPRELIYIPCLNDSADQVALLCDEIATALNS